MAQSASSSSQPDGDKAAPKDGLSLTSLLWLRSVVGALPVQAPIGSPQFKRTALAAIDVMEELEAAVVAAGGPAAQPTEDVAPG